MTTQRKLRAGILGAARIAPAALIAPARASNAVSVEAVAARDTGRAEEFARVHSIARVLPGYMALVSDPDIDLVYNALPISEHARWSEAALRCGKHVLCEKPLAMNANEAQRILDASSADARLIEAFHCRYHPAYETLSQWLQEPRCGAVTSISAHFNVGIADDGSDIRYRPELGGGAMMDLGCYPLMWALFVMGVEPVAVEASARMTASGVDESMHATLHFDSGARADLSCSMAAQESFANQLSVMSEHTRIDFDNPLLPQDGRLARRVANQVDVATLDSATTYEHQLASVAAALLNNTALPTEGDALIRQQRTLDRIYEAAGLSALRYRRI